jgi:hypothetical protein
MSQFYVGVTAGSLPPTVPTSFLLDDTGVAVPLANQIIVHGDTGVTTSLGASNEIVLNVVTDSFKWLEENGDFLASAQRGYFCNVALTATLPAIALLGSTVIFYVDVNAANVVIKANVGQFIEVGGVISSSGGTATANVQGSMLGLVFKLSDLTWHAVESMGSWTIV